MGIVTPSPRVVDMGLSHDDVTEYFAKSGYWGTKELKERYACTLSPAAYVLSTKDQASLHALSLATYGAVKELNNKLCTIAGSTHIPPRDGHFLKLAGAATRGLLRPLDQEYRIPDAMKVDLVLDGEGNFNIAEVDVYNPRGFGFAALLEGIVPKEFRDNRYAGVKLLASQLKRYDVGTWYFIVSEYERFYEATFNILARALREYGVMAFVVREEALAQGTEIPEGSGVFAIPASMNAYPTVRQSLIERYRQGSLVCFYPPVAYLESKAFLPFLRTQPGMEQFIPEATLVGKRCEERELEGPLVLKAAVSSGMKGVWFSDLDREFNERLLGARTHKVPAWILQKQVPQRPVLVPVYVEDAPYRVVPRHLPYYLRVTAYVTKDGILDVEVTGRPDQKVHGAPDCIQIPVLLE